MSASSPVVPNDILQGRNLSSIAKFIKARENDEKRLKIVVMVCALLGVCYRVSLTRRIGTTSSVRSVLVCSLVKLDKYSRTLPKLERMSLHISLRHFDIRRNSRFSIP